MPNLAELEPLTVCKIPFIDLVPETFSRTVSVVSLAQLQQSVSGGSNELLGDSIIKNYYNPPEPMVDPDIVDHGITFDDWQEREIKRCLGIFPEFSRRDVGNLFATVLNARTKGLQDKIIYRRLTERFHPDLQDNESTAACALVMGLYRTNSSPLAPPSGFDF